MHQSPRPNVSELPKSTRKGTPEKSSPVCSEGAGRASHNLDFPLTWIREHAVVAPHAGLSARLLPLTANGGATSGSDIVERKTNSSSVEDPDGVEPRARVCVVVTTVLQGWRQ